MAVIAINQQLGCRGAELGRIAAGKLGYRFLTSDDIMAAGSRAYNVDAEQLKVTDERQPHFWERLTTDLDRLVVFFRAATLKEMAGDRVVVVGRWVGLIMPDVRCGVRVRAAAPFVDRVRQVALDERLDQAAAEKRVRDNDREIRARVQHLHAVDIDDPSLYSIMLNTAAMPIEAVAATLIECANQAEHHCREGLERLCDESIAAQVRAALLAHPKIGNARVHVQCKGRAVRLIGMGLVPPWDALVEQTARQVEGVASVEVAVEEPPIAPRSG